MADLKIVIEVENKAAEHVLQVLNDEAGKAEESIQKLGRTTESYTEEAGKASEATQKAGEAMSEASGKGGLLKDALEGMAGRYAGVVRAAWPFIEVLKTAGLAIGAFVATAAAGWKIFDWGREAAEAERMRDRIGAAYGRIFETLKASSEGLVGNKALRGFVAEVNEAGISIEQAGQLMQVAHVKAKDMKVSQEEAFAAIINGINDLRPGLVDTAEAYKEYATQTGKSVGQLTEFEKKQALANKIIKEGTADLKLHREEALKAYDDFEMIAEGYKRFGVLIGNAWDWAWGGVKEASKTFVQLVAAPAKALADWSVKAQTGIDTDALNKQANLAGVVSGTIRNTKGEVIGLIGEENKLALAAKESTEYLKKQEQALRDLGLATKDAREEAAKLSEETGPKLYSSMEEAMLAFKKDKDAEMMAQAEASGSTKDKSFWQNRLSGFTTRLKQIDSGGITGNEREEVEWISEKLKEIRSQIETLSAPRIEFSDAIAEAEKLALGFDALGKIVEEEKHVNVETGEAMSAVSALRSAIDAIPNTKTVRIRVVGDTTVVGGSPTPGDSGAVQMAMAEYHSGGVIGSSGGLRRFHSGGALSPDERMIIGLDGEGIVNREGMRSIGKAGLDAINSGRGAGPTIYFSTSITVNAAPGQDGAALARQLDRAMADMVRSGRSETARALGAA